MFGGRFDERQNHGIVLAYLPTKYLNYQGEAGDSVIKNTGGMRWHHMLPDETYWEQYKLGGKSAKIPALDWV